MDNVDNTKCLSPLSTDIQSEFTFFYIFTVDNSVDFENRIKKPGKSIYSPFYTKTERKTVIAPVFGKIPVCL